WRIAMSTTGNERGLMLRSPGRFLAAADRLVRLWRATGEDPAVRDRVADAVIGARAYQLFTAGGAARFAAGGTIGAESSLNKVFWSRYDIALHETALDPWQRLFLFSRADTVYAGSSEIQRNIIAERVLGLPKEPRP
ncbi:acyl-CoA dehydrogenase, partial [Streptomyces sp. ms191]|uniref:acyl-CoA dehydrogenase family protein n=1 Tax=Streptomyces sp. ms191 TaxID=1827978 RepID=UPI0013121D99